MTASHPALSLPPSALWQPVAPGTTGDAAFGHNKEISTRNHGVFTHKTTYDWDHTMGMFNIRGIGFDWKTNLKLLQDLRKSKHIRIHFDPMWE